MNRLEMMTLLDNTIALLTESLNYEEKDTATRMIVQRLEDAHSVLNKQGSN